MHLLKFEPRGEDISVGVFLTICIMQDKDVTQYFLRHTFATTCVQYVRPDIVDTWMGDSSERLVGRVYTHFPDKFMTNQMDLVQFEY